MLKPLTIKFAPPHTNTGNLTVLFSHILAVKADRLIAQQQYLAHIPLLFKCVFLCRIQKGEKIHEQLHTRQLSLAEMNTVQDA